MLFITSSTKIKEYDKKYNNKELNFS